MTDVANDAAPVVEGVPVTINGVEIIAHKGELVIDAAERHGVYIPRFCHHPRMKPVGMCRMCIAEVDTGRGPALQPTCMLECTPGMIVHPESEVTKKAQEGVLEFLLINHPLDCPVCDKGGECPLQDQAFSHGPGETRFVEEKRHNEKPIPISDLVLLDRERCILCDRCTRFAKDVAGDPLIHFINRGNNTEVNTFPDEPFASYFSGNTVQICPVGALTSTSYRFRARPWDLDKSESTCTTCAVGCRVSIESSRNEVLRYQGVDIDPVNWGWLCDKGRFGFESLDSDHRLRDPLIKGANGFEVARWNDAVKATATALQDAINTVGPSGVAFLGGARLTNEAAYAFAKLAKGVIGTDNVDCQLADGMPAEAVLGLPKATIDDVCRAGGTIVLIGPDLKEELPVLFLRLRHAVIEDGVKLIQLTPALNGCSSLASVVLQHRPGEAHEVVRALYSDIPVGRDGGGVQLDALDQARALIGADRPLTAVLGRQSIAEGPEWVLDAAAALQHHAPGITFLTAIRRGNTHGALDMGLAPGLLPGRTTVEDAGPWFAGRWPTMPSATGLDALGILTAAANGQIHTLVLLGADPMTDFPDRALVERALGNVRNLIAVDLFITDSVERATIVLASAGFGEVDGTTTNLEGRVSVVNQKVTPPGTARADWEIAAELAHRLGSDLEVESVEQLRAEIAELAPAYVGLTDAVLFATDAADGVLVPLPGLTFGGASAPVTDAGAGAWDRPSDVVGNIEGDVAADSESDAVGPGDVEDAELVGPVLPALVTFRAGEPLDPPALDAYSLRLVATRKLYDLGTATQLSPLLTGLPSETPLRVNPYDFDRLGVPHGAELRVKTPNGSINARVVTDPLVLRGTAVAVFNQPGFALNELIDASSRVTDIRIEAGGR